MADTTKLTIELDVILRRLNQTLRGLDQVRSRLQQIAAVRVGVQQTQATGRAAIATQRLQLAQQRLQVQQQRLNQQQQQLAVGAQRLAIAQGRAALAAQRLTRAQQQLTTGGSRVNTILQQTQQRMNSLGAAALRVGGGLRSVGASASILVTGPLTALGTIAAKSAADIDAIRNRLTATEGSLQAANERLAQLRKLADSSIGVTRRAAVDTFSILATLGEVTEDTINKQIRSFGRLNAAFTIDDQQLFFRNLLQIFQQGFEIKDIKEALGRVPIFNQLLQTAFGTADPKKLRELKQAGKLTLDTFLAGLATAIETDPVLGKIGESISVRFQKAFERLRDALEPLGLAILGPLERIVTAVEPVILRLSEAFASLSPSIQTVIVVVGLLTAALGPVLFILGGIASGIGALATAAAALLPVLASIGLPAIAAILAGLAIAVGEVTVALTALGLAWRSNFLGIRQLVAQATTAVLGSLNRIRAIFAEATQRILPTLQSITTKVLSAITAAWERYGKVVVQIVGDVFAFVSGVTETFLRAFTNFVDLVLKLIDGDWRGAWRAFARIVVGVMDSIIPLLGRLHRAVATALNLLLAFVLSQALKFAEAGRQLATQFVLAIAADLVAGAPRIKDALFLMLVTAAAGVSLGPIAQALVARLIAELRRAAGEGIPLPEFGPQVGGDLSRVAGIFGNRPRRRTGLATTTDTGTGSDREARRLAREADKLREAQDELNEARLKAQIEDTRAAIDQQLALTKDGLDREQRALDAGFEDRLKSVQGYYAERTRLEQAQVDAEIAKEKGLSKALTEEFFLRRRQIEGETQTARAEVLGDTRLKGRARELALQRVEIERETKEVEALNDFEKQNAEVSTRLLLLRKQRTDVANDNLRAERELTRELKLQREQIAFDLLEAQGRTAEAETGRLKARFTQTLRDLRLDTSGLTTALQIALNKVDVGVLKRRLEALPEPVRQLLGLLDIGIQRARIAEQAAQVDRLGVNLRLEEQQVQNKVLDGLINQRDAQEQIVGLQQRYRDLLLEVLRAELAKAEAIKDQDQILAIRQQIADTERLGIAIDEVGQQVNQQLFSDLQSGLSGIFSGARRGFEGLRDAAISFGERLLDTLNDIAASSILKQLEQFFKPDATNTQGTVGGFFSKLFGLKPKDAGATAAGTALQTGATTAAASLTTGATAAAAALTTGGATAATTIVTAITAAATAFTAAVTAAGAAFAATVAVGSATGGAGGGLAGLLGGAATGLFPAQPGGVYKIVEGGYPEAVLTTDPKHALRQVAILRAFLRETRGLGGRIKGLAAGGFMSPSEALSGIGVAPMVLNSSLADIPIQGSGPTTVRIRQTLVDPRTAADWLNTPEGERSVLTVIEKNRSTVRRLTGN